jgi:uncharacterized membrane protein YdjX (TVP38/TMEM64 family)
MQKYIPLLLLFLGLVAAYFFGLHEYFNLESLKVHRQTLKTLVAQHWAMASFLFILTYLALTAAAIPIDAFMCLTSGFLFSQPFSTLYILIASLTGGILLFLAARTAFGDLLKRKAGPRLQKMEANFQKNAAAYLIFLRLIPIMPSWLINLTPALFGVPLKTFTWASIIGILPGAYVFSQAGTGLGTFLDSPEEPNFSLLFNREFYIGLILMLLFALALLLAKWCINKKTSQ